MFFLGMFDVEFQQKVPGPIPWNPVIRTIHKQGSTIPKAIRFSFTAQWWCLTSFHSQAAPSFFVLVKDPSSLCFSILSIFTVDGSEIPKQPPGMYIKPYIFWDTYHINWCFRRISSSINDVSLISTTRRLSKALPNILSDSGLSHQRQERSVDSSMCFHVAWLQIPGFKKWWFFKPWKIQTTKLMWCEHVKVPKTKTGEIGEQYKSPVEGKWNHQSHLADDPRPKDAFFEIDMADAEEPKVEGVSWKDV